MTSSVLREASQDRLRTALSGGNGTHEHRFEHMNCGVSGKESTHFPYGQEGICAGSGLESQLQSWPLLWTPFLLSGPNLAFVLASGDAPLANKHGIAVFQGGHRVKESRSKLKVQNIVGNLLKVLSKEA